METYEGKCTGSTHRKLGMLPKARTNDLLTEIVGNETVAYDLDSKDVHCLNPLAAAVFEACDGHTSVEQLAADVGERLSMSLSAEQVKDAVAQLEECKLLDAPDTPLMIRGGGHTRREAVQKVAFAGATAAFAAPLITSIVSPSAAMAQSGNPTGCKCSKNKDCASNHCCKTAGGNDKCNDGCCASDNNGTLCQCTVVAGTGKCATINVPVAEACGTAGVCTPSPASFNCAL